MSHRHHKTICIKCKKITHQCRCLSADKVIVNGICDECKKEEGKMTKTTCPTCGGKCLVEKCKACDNPLHGIYTTLPPPDLTKLQNALYNYEHDRKWYKSRVEESINKLIQAIKEVLDEQV